MALTGDAELASLADCSVRPRTRGRAGAEVPRLHARPARRRRLGAARGRLGGWRFRKADRDPGRRRRRRRREASRRVLSRVRSGAHRPRRPGEAESARPATVSSSPGNLMTSRRFGGPSRSYVVREAAAHGNLEMRKSASSTCSSCSRRCGLRTETRRRLCSTSFAATMRASLSRSRPGAPAYGWSRCRTRPGVSPGSGAAES